MLRHLWGVWLTVLLFAAEGRAAQFIPLGTGCQRNATADKPLCRGEKLWRRLVRNVDKGIVSISSLTGSHCISQLTAQPAFPWEHTLALRV